MPRPNRLLRGRRVAWLLASALPLLATDEMERIGDHTNSVVAAATRLSGDSDNIVEGDAVDQFHAVYSDEIDSIADETDGNHGPLHLQQFARTTPMGFDTALSPATSRLQWSSFRLPWERQDLEWCEILDAETVANRTEPFEHSETDTFELEEVQPLNGTEGDAIQETEPPDDDPKDNNETAAEPAPDPSTTSASAAIDDRIMAAVDYASKSAGGLVLEKSHNFKGTSNLLTSDRDRYAIVECEEPTKWVVIGLSEDILVKRVVLAMYERYSSHVKDFALFASTTATDWREMGNFTAAPNPGDQIFDMPVPMWARYLKFQILSYYGNEHYCTVSQIKVMGSTVLQGFHEQWQESDDTHEAPASISDDEATEMSSLGSDVECAKSSELSVSESSTPNVTGEIQSDLSDSSNISGDTAEVDSSGSMETDGIDWESNSCNTSSATWCSFGAASRAQVSPSSSSLELETRPWQNATLSHSTMTNQSSVSNAENVSAVSAASPSLSFVLPLVQQVQTICNRSGWNISFIDVLPLPRSKYQSINASSSMLGNATISEPERPLEAEADASEKILIEVDDSIRSTASEASTKPLRADPIEPMVFFTDSAVAERLLQRVPSANCLSKLDAALASHRQIKRGSGGGSGHGGGAAHAAGGMEPIFKKLTDEIKALQGNVGFYDEFTRESMACYRHVLADLFRLMEADRVDQDARLRRLEREFSSGTVMVAVRALFIQLGMLLSFLYELALSKPTGHRDRLLQLVFLCVLGALAALYRRRQQRCKLKKVVDATASVPCYSDTLDDPPSTPELSHEPDME